MKKKFLFAALAAATGLMTSCSSDDELSSTDSQASNTIAFSTNKNVGKVSTPLSRSGETVTSLNKFYVTALNPDNSVFFDSETFNYSGGVFQSSTAHYWPTTGTLSFYAINEEGTKAVDVNNVPNYTYTDWEGEIDLVAATAIAGEKQMPYPLTFKHLTSQVIIGAEAEDKTEELTYKLISVTMTAPSTGTYSFDTVTGGTGSWSIDNSKTTEYSYADALPMSFAQSATNKLDNCYWNILPTTDGKLYFKVQYQVYQNGKLITDYTGDKYKECTVENPNLQAGKIYTYNFLLSRSTNDEITFTTTITDWDNGTTTDLNVPAHAESIPVDLGLPSGLKWAQGNLGAIDETDTGLYYAWGETTGYEKNSGHNFNSATYTASSIQTDLTLEQDAAHVKLGGNWRMPTKTEFEELYSNTTMKMLTMNGIVGYKFTATNGNYIFLPASGFYNGTNIYSWQTGGRYRTTTFYSGDVSYYMYMDSYSNRFILSSNESWCGMSVRGVCK